jgi:hypothetical protein
MDLNSFSRTFTDRLRLNRFSRLFSDPIYVGVLVTASILLIVLTSYDSDHIVRTSFYIFGATEVIIFLHNKLIISEYKERIDSAQSSRIVQTLGSGEIAESSSLVTDIGLKYLIA